MQISHPNLGSPNAMVTSNAELVVTGSGVLTGYSTDFFIGSPLPVRIYQESGIGPAMIDKATLGQKSISHIEESIYNGEHYCMEGYFEGGDGDELNIAITTPNGSKWAHLTFEFSAPLGFTTEFWEGVTDVSGGMAATPINSNRNSSNTTDMIFKRGAVANSGTATLLSQGKWGTNKIGGGASREDELVLKSGTNYYRKIISNVNSNIIYFKGCYGEHTDIIKQW